MKLLLFCNVDLFYSLVFKYQTIRQSDTLYSFEYQSSLVFRSPLYGRKLGVITVEFL